MHHGHSNKQQTLRRYAILTFMTLLVVVGVIILTAFSWGYSFNRQDGKLEQGGILQLGSKPSGATITVDDTKLSSRTSAKFVAQPGEYHVKMHRSGYQDWQKTLPIQAGNITWATYARLIPKKLTPEVVATYKDGVEDALAASSGEKYAVLVPAETPRVIVQAINKDDVDETVYDLPADSYTDSPAGEPSKFVLDAWNGDENKLLLQHTYGKGGLVEWILFDLKNPDKSININRSLGVGNDIASPKLTIDNGMEIYALMDGSVRVLNLSDRTISRPLVTNVTDFSMYADTTVLFTRNESAVEQQVGYVRANYEEPRIVKELPGAADAKALLSVGNYFDTYYFLIAQGEKAIVYASDRMPSNAKTELKLTHKQTLELESPITKANIISNGQLATVQSGHDFSTYNLETGEVSHSKVMGEIAQTLQYLDSYTFWSDNGGTLHTYEFDGANQHDLMPFTSKYGATLAMSGKYIYGLSTDKSGNVVMTRVKLIES